MPRRIYVSRPDESLAAARAAAAAFGAAEIWTTLSPKLAALGADSYGAHVIDPPPSPPPPLDPRAELLARLQSATMLDEMRDIVADAITGGVV